MKTKQIEKADTSKRLPWRRTWAAHAIHKYNYLYRPFGAPAGFSDLVRYSELHDECHNVPREPHTQTVLYARDVWQRPAKLMPFKDMRFKLNDDELRATMRFGYNIFER